ncbi:MAG: hemerythrin domain-containing protein [Pseudomonadota bacterium]
MSRTQILRRQHQTLDQLATQLEHSMEQIKTHDDAMRCARQLAKMTGILQFHLAAEDHSLYPRMQASSDPTTARTARSFAQEMGGLATAYAEFADKWRTGNAILSDPEGFRTEAQLIFSALSKRIERENEELYPLAELMDSTTFAAREPIDAPDMQRS